MVDYYIPVGCISCGSKDLTDVLSLGEQYLSDFPAKPDSTGLPKAPLDLRLCGGCDLLQLKHIVNRDLIYRDYWYQSGVNESMRLALKDVVDSVERIVKRNYEPVLDIGANDGTLLGMYSGAPTRVGFEPANLSLTVPPNLNAPLHILPQYFSADALNPSQKYRIVTAIAMFYSVPEPVKFLRDVKKVLAEDGVFVIQMNYLGDMIADLTYDNIGHEHVAYYSLSSLNHALLEAGLEPFRIESNAVNGGSIRVYIQHEGGPYRRDTYLQGISQWEVLCYGYADTYRGFAYELSMATRKLRHFIGSEGEKGAVTYVYGASNRGNTILQYCGLNSELIAAAADRNPRKHGRYTVGTHIPIVSEEQFRKDAPDYALVLPYSFLSEFVSREADWLQNGGRFVVPVPTPHLISKDGREEVS